MTRTTRPASATPVSYTHLDVYKRQHWTRYDLEGTTAERWVSWTFAYTPEAPGAYQMKVRSVNEDGNASPIAAVHTFEVL